jgi:hypothetical protein
MVWVGISRVWLAALLVLAAGIAGCDAKPAATRPGHSASPTATDYDGTVLSGRPVAYWAMTNPGGSEPDLSGNHHSGSYPNGGRQAALPNGDGAVDFDGLSQYMTVPSDPSFSIPAAHQLSWEAWIRPDILQWTRHSDPHSDGYVLWLGKCQEHTKACEWDARLYSSSDTRCNRLSAYVYNPSGGLGSGAFWQAACGFFKAGQWIHVVGEYQTLTNPKQCDKPVGTIDIWVNGVQWNASHHYPTGCMSQYSVTPVAGGSALNVGTVAMDSFFPGAIGKVAIYDRLLTQDEIAKHYEAMTGKQPAGACADTCK